ncbi:MAG: hypothetical protein KJN64_02470 [Ignavibacteria bacterium]|nr:hypothetical protein [Ignavibacteria bacterium]MBT8384066.1 hypothetical protein [Ignavibacteria bacterium]MBT8392100.1 hypothetical protein [Ignavibacteria bacterium]NNL22779.1 hypothetical protein [Ignavibacteriaceae bacterium]
MKKKNLKFLIPITVMLIILTIVKLAEPEEIDWSESFSKNDKIPYGGYIIYDVASKLFDEAELTLTEFPCYNVLKNDYYYKTNYVIINSYFSPDILDTEYLLDYVATGNQVFISAFAIYGSLADSLRISTYRTFFNDDSTSINFNLAEVKSIEDYFFEKGNFENYFSEYDTSLIQVLGTNSHGKTNFIRIKYGEGDFFLNTVPLAFSNYHLLYSVNEEYAFKCLSHLPNTKTLWDEYYKIGNKYSVSALQYILSHESLMWAYYLLLGNAVLFIFFYGRRRQRIIPVVEPLKNTTVEFVQTVGNLYYQQKDFKNIAEKKISYFLDYIRNKYFIKALNFDEETLKKISDKSSLSFGKVKAIFREIEKIKMNENISEEDLININYQIEKFYERIK